MRPNNSIVFLSISSHLGGAERSLIDLAEKTKLEGRYRPIVVLPGPGPLEDKLKALGITSHHIALPAIYENISRSNILSFASFAIGGWPAYVQYINKVKTFLAENQPHAVHSTGIKNHVLCCLLSKSTNHHYYLHLRDYIHPAIAAFLKLFANTKTIHWMAASKSITKNLNWPIPIFYDGLHASQFFKHPTSDLKQSLMIPSHAKLVGHAAALTPWKGQMVFIEAAAEILKTRKDVHFAIIGSPIYKTNADKSYLDDLRAKVKSLNISSNVHFIPFIEESRKIYDGLDLFVHSSLTPEPFGRVILEALFCETPVVAARAGGALEILPSDVAKDILHSPGDITSLARAIEKGLAFNANDLKVLVQDAKSRFPAEICYKKQVEYLSEAH